MDTASIVIPSERRSPLLNLSSNKPTKSGMNMYGIKFERPIRPRSKYDAPITSFEKTGTIGLCIPYDIPTINAVTYTRISGLFMSLVSSYHYRPTHHSSVKFYFREVFK